MSETAIFDQSMRDALDRIARTHDGELLYRYLQKALMGVPVLSAPGSESALLIQHGRRSFASELMSLMAKGIEERCGRNSDDTSAAGRPVVFTVAKPVTYAVRGTRRRVSLPDDAGPDAA